MPLHERDPRTEKKLDALGLRINPKAREVLESDQERGDATQRLLDGTRDNSDEPSGEGDQRPVRKLDP